MFDSLYTPPHVDAAHASRFLAQVQCHVSGAAPMAKVPLRITNDVSPPIHCQPREGHPRVPLAKRRHLRYAGISADACLAVCALLGLAEWRSLMDNDLIIEEDFHHSEPSKCLFGARSSKPSHASIFDRPQVCKACVEFYTCLSAGLEMAALDLLLSNVGDLDPA